MYKIILVILALALAGCGTPDPGRDNNGYNTICVDGVKYLYFKGMSGNHGYGYMSVKFNKESKVETCNEFIPEAHNNESY